jgi:NAD(P)-dependent dehydrogenase (short-subunit alcohol dehydrogenase family)
MNIDGKHILVLGGGGMVGNAVCRELLMYRPASLVVASRREPKARGAVEKLRAEYPQSSTRILPVWGDVFLRAAWQEHGADARQRVLADTEKRRRMIADLLDPLDEEIVGSSMLVDIILGIAPGLDGTPAQIVVDCMNTATIVSYQNVYAGAQRLAKLAREDDGHSDWPAEVEGLLASLYIPQLVRHVQLLYEAMRRAGTEAYAKVGTSGTGGMGFNIPFTHGEEKPSRLLLSKAALAGAQSLLNFLMARTPAGPRLVKELKPTALIGWEKMDHGAIRRSGQDIALYDCPPQQAVSVRDRSNLAASGRFGNNTGKTLQAVFIDTGENGKFSAAEFSTITAPGMMQLVTPEEVARHAVQELAGRNTGHDVVAALDGAVIESTYRAGYLRQAALTYLHQLEARHGEAVAFEILGPPRLSKLLFEAYLLRRAGTTLAGVFDKSPEQLASLLEQEVLDNAELRQRIISIGIPILLADGEHLLRGPTIKSQDAYHGWLDLTVANMTLWQARLREVDAVISHELEGDTSSRHDRMFGASRDWQGDGAFPDIGELVAWIFSHEEEGMRGKT